MLTENGGKLLREFTEKNYQERVEQITDGVWYALAMGHSNAVFVEGKTSVILIDTLDCVERGELLAAVIKEKTGKPVKTILYTHIHPDHRGGAGAFTENDPEIIAFAPAVTPLERTGMLKDIQGLRGARQFGYSLTDEETISQGIGIREGVVYGGHHGFVPPTTIYNQEKVEREIDGVKLELLRVPGETDDQMMVWIPEKGVLCCGDNYYGCFPNLYAIRGSQYRDLASWIRSLDVILSYPAQYLVPGHTAMISGNETIREILGNFRSMIDYLLTKTLEGMNQGKTEDQLAAEIRLPEEYAGLPYLGEYYGCAEWTVRAIYTAYLGWFDGNPTSLHPLAPADRAAKLLALAGGRETVLQAAQAAFDEGDYQWCLELCDMLMDGAKEADQEAMGVKAKALEQIAEQETSANGRHYYLVCARELRDRLSRLS